MIKTLFKLSLRMVTGFVQSLIKLCGLAWTAPDYSTLCRRQRHIDIAIGYQKSSGGLHLLVDSTCLKFLGEGEWKRKKMDLNIVANGVRFILVSMLKLFKYVLYTSPQIMSVIHRYWKIYLLKSL